MYNKGDWWVEVSDNYTTVESMSQTICSDVSNCDAHLIAASPMMYEALKDIASCFRNIVALEELVNNKEDGELHLLAECVRGINQALSKAEGCE